MQDTRDATVRIAVDREPGDCGGQARFETVAQPGDACVLVGAFVVGHLQRGGQRDDAADVLGAGPAPLFVSATFDERPQRDAAADDERADTLRAAELVTGDRDEIRAGGAFAEVEPLRRLHRVGVEDRVRRPLTYQRGDGGDRLDDTGLVVDEHDRHDRGAFVERGRKRVEVDPPVGAGTDRRDPEALVLQAEAAPMTALCSIPVVTTPSPVPRSRASRLRPSPRGCRPRSRSR